MNDAEREMLIAYHVEHASHYVRVAWLARYHIGRARELINGRSQEQIKRMEKQRGLA